MKTNKIISQIFKVVINLPLAEPNFIVISTPCDKLKKHILKYACQLTL